MSVDMIDHIVDERRIDIDSGTIKRVKVRWIILIYASWYHTRWEW